MRVSRTKTQFMVFALEQNDRGNRDTVNILGEEPETVSHLQNIWTSI